MSTITEWTQQEVIEAIKADLVANMEIAAGVVETDARKRLLRIQEPDFGRAYRRVLALYRLISRIVVGKDVVEGQIGIPGGEKGSDYGFWIEIGSHTYAAQPWLRPALVAHLKDVIRLLAGV